MSENNDKPTYAEEAKKLVDTAKKDKFGVAKMLTRLVVGHSVSTTLVSLVHQNTETSTPIQKAKLYVGAYFVGQIVADLARDRVDSTFTQLNNTIEAAKKQREELEENETVEDDTNN